MTNTEGHERFGEPGIARRYFFEFAQKVWASKKQTNPPMGTILALDPGHTTGIFIVRVDPHGIHPLHISQQTTFPISKGAKVFSQLLQTYNPDYVITEAYRVYEWKAKDHSWSDVPTLRVIGCLETILAQHQDHTRSTTSKLPTLHYQTAEQGKAFCTDDRLKEWGLYYPGFRHGRDAIRHACHAILFGLTDAADF